MKRIALPVVSGKLSAHFGHAPHFYIYETEGTEIIKEEMLVPPPHEPGSIPNWLADIKITDIISGGMGQMAINIFLSNGINAHVGAPPESPKYVIEAFINGTLKMQSNMCNSGEHGEGNCDH